MGRQSEMPAVDPPDARSSDVLLWLATLVVGGVLLAWTGGGALATPSLVVPADWSAWIATTDPLVVVAAVLRLVALGLVWYLVGLSAVALAARLLHAELLARSADVLAIGPAVLLVRRIVGTGLAVGVLASSTSLGPGPVAPSPLAGVPDAPATTTGVSDDMPTDADRGVVELRRSDGAQDRDGRVGDPDMPPSITDLTTERGRSTSGEPSETGPAPWTERVLGTPAGAADVHAAMPAGVEVQVRPGDHLWSMAADALAAHHGTRQDDATVAAYWVEVLAANADRLVVPNDPDLLVPGQVVLLPAIRGGSS